MRKTRPIARKTRSAALEIKKGALRREAKRISIFNHKGGVGKTTLTLNLAATLAMSGRRVLLVDADPQCNLTSYLVSDEVVDDLLDQSDGDSGQTVWTALKPVHEALGGYHVTQPIESGIENLYLIPGDIRLSEFETDLAEFWGQCLQRKMRGFRGTTALSEMVNAVAGDLGADYVFFDSGPNIGPLNRAILLDCDFFIVPVACDLFSLRALKTLGRTLVDWIGAWTTICDWRRGAHTFYLDGRFFSVTFHRAFVSMADGRQRTNQNSCQGLMERCSVRSFSSYDGLMVDLRRGGHRVSNSRK